jgi:hypothetical protein
MARPWERRLAGIQKGCTGTGDGALETTADEALIRGLGAVFRGCASGLFSFLESEESGGCKFSCGSPGEIQTARFDVPAFPPR